MFAISNDDDEKTKNCQGIIISQSVTHSLSFSLDINNHLTVYMTFINHL